MLNIFVLIATVLLAFVASIWSSKGWPNIIVKLVFVLAAVFGAIVTASVWRIV